MRTLKSPFLPVFLVGLLVFSILAGVSVFSIFSPRPAQADGDPLITVDLDTPHDVYLGKSFSVPVNISTVQGLKGAQFTIIFDDRVIQWQNPGSGKIGTRIIEPGDEMTVEQINNPPQPAGFSLYRINISFEPDSVSGNGTLAVLNFNVIGELGQSGYLCICNGILSGINGPIAATWICDYVTIRECSGPDITVQPEPQTVCEGDQVTFSADAAGAPDPAVQWQVSYDGGINWQDIPGETGKTLTFTATRAHNCNLFRAVFSSICNETATQPASLTVQLAPVVTVQPLPQTACEWDTVIFTATATGVPVPSIQWQVSTNGGSIWSDIPGANSTIYSFSASATQDGNQYRVVFTNVCGTMATDAAMLTVNSKPVILSDPANQIVCAGDNVCLIAAASGQPAPSVQWQLLPGGGSNWNNIPGATSDSYCFTADPDDDGNQYRAVFTNSCGTTTTCIATLTVNTKPEITVQPLPQTVCEGDEVSFTAAASGVPTPTVKWQVLKSGSPGWEDIPGATSTTLTFITASADNGNQYHAIFSNVCGNVNTCDVVLTINTAPVVTAQPENRTACAGDNVCFAAAASGKPAPTVQWQMLLSGEADWEDIQGATSVQYCFTASSSDDGNQYRAVFTNACGTVTTGAASLEINTVPEITAQPEDVAVCEGNTACFTAEATAVPAPAVQWQVKTGDDWSNIPGATSPQYCLTAAPGDDGKQYRAVFTNICGQTATEPVQ